MTNKEGWALAEAGAQQAADASGPDWQDRAMAVFNRYLTNVQPIRFTSENLRDYAENSGLPQPPDPRAWGQILLTASKEGRIVKAGYTTSKNRHAHCRPIAQWCLP